jgi:hypothetical protein
MMMSKPQEGDTEEVAPPAFSTAPSSLSSPPKMGRVEELERRLAMIGKEEQDKKPAATMAPPPTTTQTPTVAAVVAPPAAVEAPLKGGKNALLVSRSYSCVHLLQFGLVRFRCHLLSL